MQAAWNRGDWRLFAAMLTNMRRTSPQSYNLMFAQRNAHWASWIAQRLQRPGTVFVAVGTGHLVGRDSVQAKLALRGFRSARSLTLFEKRTIWRIASPAARRSKPSLSSWAANGRRPAVDVSRPRDTGVKRGLRGAHAAADVALSCAPRDQRTTTADVALVAEGRGDRGAAAPGQSDRQLERRDHRRPVRADVCVPSKQRRRRRRRH